MVDLGSSLLSKFLTIYLFGGLIILLYAKDKFNMPTYDKDAMGPFAQLPPQLLTMDARYRWGRTVYILLMLGLYTAICVAGPTTFKNLPGSISPSIPGADNSEVWPVAAAAFLISTGAANDNNMLGRIELLIRQYAHKSAYIPSTVSDLAFTLRTVNIHQWLIANPHIEESELRERQRALSALIGPENLDRIKAQPGQEGQLAAWVRANILFYTLQQIFNKRVGLSTSKLDYLTDLPENRQIFDNISGAREKLMPEFKGAIGSVEDESGKILAAVQRFSKDTSLMIAVLLSQTARNTNYLTDRLDQLGFQGVELRDRSDHFTYTVMVNSFIFAGSFIAAAVLAVAWLPALTFLTWLHDVRLLDGAIMIFTGSLVYLVMFKATDYWRDKLLDSLDWREDLEGYVKLTLNVSLLSCIVSLVLTVLILSLFSLVDFFIYGPIVFAQFLLFYFLTAGLGTVFSLIYMRQAARMLYSRLSLFTNLLSFTALGHAAIAAFIVGSLNLSMYMYNVYSAPKAILSVLQVSWPPTAQDPKQGFVGRYSETEIASVTKGLSDFSSSLSKLEIGNAATQLTAVRAICAILNNPNAATAAMAGASTTTQPKPGAIGPAAQSPPNAVTRPLFSDAGSCKIGDPAPGDQRVAFAALLSDFENSLTVVSDAAAKQYFAWVFPALAAFLIAYSFGVGCRHWRAWWLNNDEDYLTDLKAQIRKSYGNEIDVVRCLTCPISLLGNVAPIEAIRYEDYRSKLLANIQKRKIVWPRWFYNGGAIVPDKKAEADLTENSSAALPALP